MDPHWIHVLHVADYDAIVIAIPHDFVFDLLPLLEIFLDQDLIDPTVSKSSEGKLPKRAFIKSHSRPLTSQRVGDPDHDREPDLSGRLKGCFQVNCLPAFWNGDTMFDHGFLEQFPIVSNLYALDSRAENLHVVFRQNTALCKFDAAVESGLSPKAQEDTVGLFFRDNFLEKVRPYRNRIHLVRELLISVNSGNVWIHNDCSKSLFSKSLNRLRC